MASLDDAKALFSHDSSRMLDQVALYVEEFAASFEAGAGVAVPPATFSNAVLCGMGGSGIVGDLVLAAVDPTLPLAASVAKDYHVPRWIRNGSLVVAISYSGDTEETLNCALEAQEQGAFVIGISSGGGLARVCRGRRSLHVPLPSGRQPRAALSYLFGTTLGVAQALGWAKLQLDDAWKQRLRGLQQALGPSSPEPRNPAKQFARDLFDKVPVWYASSPLGPVALRGRAQLNENAKMQARHQVLPESSHNDLVAWAHLDRPANHFVGLLRQPDEPPEIRHRFDFLHSVLKRGRVSHREYVVGAPDRLGRILEALVFVDHVSLYAAALRGVDPGPIEVIGELKGVMARKGMAPQLAKRVGALPS